MSSYDLEDRVRRTLAENQARWHCQGCLDDWNIVKSPDEHAALEGVMRRVGELPGFELDEHGGCELCYRPVEEFVVRARGY